MECPSCQTSNPAGQKFCGFCGQKLEAACSQCQATNPPHYQYCGQCGAGLTEMGAVEIARSGLITQVNQKALNILDFEEKDILRKPFSLFVEQADLVIFFSHFNELVSSGNKQSFEINLKHKKKNNILVQLECSVDALPPKPIDKIHIALSEAADSRLVAAQMQTQQDLLGLIFTVTDNLSSVGKAHLAHSIEDALKKVCLFARADRCFICSVNRSLKRLDTLYEWCQPTDDPSEKNAGEKTTTLVKIKGTITKLRQERLVIIHDTATLEQAQRDELLAWHQFVPGAAAYFFIYSGKVPIGIIGAVKNARDGEWTPDSISLIRFLGNLLADRLPSPVIMVKPAVQPKVEAAVPETAIKVPRKAAAEKLTEKTAAPPSPDRVSDTASNGLSDRMQMENGQIIPDISKPMAFEKFSGDKTVEKLPVFPRDDGLVLLACPSCGVQESISVDRFEKLGNAISVNCPCGKQFTVALEKRQFLRKSVHLDGYFSLGTDKGTIGAGDDIWGPMIVQDLSKAGLRFSSEKADLIHTGDLLMVRFNLDNANHAVIHKPARVVSVSNREVGCEFEGADRYDITLGFYFM